MIDGAGLPATVANVPTLLLGVAVQHAGNKRFAFGDRSPVTTGQIGALATVEVGTFILNAIAFHLLVTLAASSYLVARCAGTMAVYLLFSFPLWARVFRDAGPRSLSLCRPDRVGNLACDLGLCDAAMWLGEAAELDRIDKVFFRSGGGVALEPVTLAPATEFDGLSDHRAVWARLQWRSEVAGSAASDDAVGDAHDRRPPRLAATPAGSGLTTPEP